MTIYFASFKCLPRKKICQRRFFIVSAKSTELVKNFTDSTKLFIWLYVLDFTKEFGRTKYIFLRQTKIICFPYPKIFQEYLVFKINEQNNNKGHSRDSM